MTPVDPAEVARALEKVLRSPSFVNADRLSRMLRFVVERTLAGEGDQLKEYLLGVEVFDRPADYDPRLDSIVRVEARRLRAKLSEYYESDGASDAVRIRLAKGGYAPTFEWPSSPILLDAARLPAEAAPDRRRWGIWIAVAGAAVVALVMAARFWPTSARSVRPEPVVTVAVLPMRVFTGNDADRRLADRLTDGITAELAREGGLGVAAYTNARQMQDGRALSEIAAALGVRVVMEGTVKAEGAAVTVEARLVDVELGRKFWVEDFTAPSGQLEGLERRVAQAAAANLLNRYRR